LQINRPNLTWTAPTKGPQPAGFVVHARSPPNGNWSELCCTDGTTTTCKIDTAANVEIKVGSYYNPQQRQQHVYNWSQPILKGKFKKTSIKNQTYHTIYIIISIIIIN